MNSPGVDATEPQYKKRLGTSGISGQLYETKLISLILFRLLHNDDVEDFYLASNMDEIGAFDDICLKIKIKERERPVVVFIQVKHRDNDDKFLTLDNKNDSVKWSDSILKIKKKISSAKSHDRIFNGDVSEAEYVFILYTNAKCDFDSNEQFDSSYADSLNSLIATSGHVGTRPIYGDKEVDELGEKILKEDIAVLVERFAKFLNDKINQSMNIMNDEYILRYHVLLVKYLVQVSEIHTDDTKWRNMTFRPSFFKSNDKHISMFRSLLYEQILKSQRPRKSSETEGKIGDASLQSESSVQEKIATFFSQPTAANLSSVIETHITCNKNGKLEFVTEKSQDDVKRLGEIHVPRNVIDEARALAAKTKLQSINLKVPIAFGNEDVAISGNSKKIERRLNHLSDTLIDLCQKYERVGEHRVVVIDDTIDSGLLSCNGGLATTVGNVLVSDSATKFLKFSDNFATLQDNAQTLYSKLENNLDNLQEYRFDVKTAKFPKLSLDCSNISREFLSKLVIYAKQSNHFEVEEILKREIRVHHSTVPHSVPANADSVFLYYHNEVQKWWMSAKSGPYLSKTSNVYRQAVDHTGVELQLSALQNMFYMTNLKYFSYVFNDDAVESFRPIETLSTLVVLTDSTTLTTIKVIQFIKRNCCSKTFTVVDLEHVLNLTTADFCALDAELRKTDKVVIIVCDVARNSRTLFTKLHELADATKQKQVIVVTNSDIIEIVEICFPTCNEVMKDTVQNLNALTSESQKYVTKNTKVIFQGQEVSMDLLVDDVSAAYVTGAVLNRIIRNESVSIGRSVSSRNYEDIKHLYVERRLNQTEGDYYYETSYDLAQLVTTLYDIPDDAILITAAPGMGKSTLLTHLSLKTKELDASLWIVRINLLEHSREFYKWQADNTVIDTLETFTFMCRVILNNKEMPICLKEVDDKLYLESCSGDEWATFELNMFLHSYNEGKLIFLFDGFDEICPHYKDNVIKFFNVVRSYPQRTKMWVTSRPYSEILPDLLAVLGKSYKIEHMTDDEQETYLNNVWKTKLVFSELSEGQLQNLKTFISFISRIMLSRYSPDALHYRFRRIYYTFYMYVYSHLPHVMKHTDFPHLQGVWISRDERPLSTVRTDVDTLLGTPLLLYFIADYFVLVSKNITKWQIDVNVITIYEMFVESKLKNILYQSKNKMDVFNPDIRMKFEKEYADCMCMHKKIAAYVLLGSPIFNGLGFEELNDIDPLGPGGLVEFEAILYAIKTGAEKAGLISHVTAEGVPVFIHRTFTEYFAAEFICDILKSDNYDFKTKKLLYTTTYICHPNDVFCWINKKIEVDKRLSSIIQQIKNTRPLFLSWYKSFFVNANWPLGLYIRVMNSSREDYSTESIFKEQHTMYMYEVRAPSAREKHFLKCQNSFISTMKPDLQKYFLALCPKKKLSWLSNAIRHKR